MVQIPGVDPATHAGVDHILQRPTRNHYKSITQSVHLDGWDQASTLKNSTLVCQGI